MSSTLTLCSVWMDLRRCVYIYMSVQTVCICVNDVSILCHLSSDLQ